MLSVHHSSPLSHVMLSVHHSSPLSHVMLSVHHSSPLSHVMLSVHHSSPLSRVMLELFDCRLVRIQQLRCFNASSSASFRMKELLSCRETDPSHRGSCSAGTETLVSSDHEEGELLSHSIRLNPPSPPGPRNTSKPSSGSV
ncbi:hypothetical protein VZT92_016661 [Zoarces viviparus]